MSSHLAYALDLTHKHLTWLEKTARDKHSSLLRKLVNVQSFMIFSPGFNIIKLFSRQNLHLLIKVFVPGIHFHPI
jgi:hypothetical protein